VNLESGAEPKSGTTAGEKLWFWSLDPLVLTLMEFLNEEFFKVSFG
jgi:hypothetical protein